MNEVKDIKEFDEVKEDGSEQTVSVSPIQQIKTALRDAKKKTVDNVCNAITWCADNPKKAITIASGMALGYKQVVRPILSDMRKFKEEHTYEFYDYVNHEPLTIKRPLNDREYKELCLYIDDRTGPKHFASDWLRARNLLK